MIPAFKKSPKQPKAVKMSVASLMSGLQSMNLSTTPSSHTSIVEGHSITERTPAADSIQKIGGIDGLRVTMHKLGVLLRGRVRGSRRVASTGRVAAGTFYS